MVIVISYKLKEKIDAKHKKVFYIYGIIIDPN